MTETIKIKVSDLTGPALDWAVARAVGESVYLDCSPFGFEYYPVFTEKCVAYRPSTDWRQGGPLIEKHQINMCWHADYDGAGLCVEADLSQNFFVSADAWDPVGPTALIAACRAIVAAKLGTEVEVPAQLVPAP